METLKEECIPFHLNKIRDLRLLKKPRDMGLRRVYNFYHRNTYAKPRYYDTLNKALEWIIGHKSYYEYYDDFDPYRKFFAGTKIYLKWYKGDYFSTRPTLCKYCGDSSLYEDMLY